MRYDIDGFQELARTNNEKKQHEVVAADQILDEVQLDFERWMVFQLALPEMASFKEWMEAEAEKKGIDKASCTFWTFKGDGITDGKIICSRFRTGRL